MFGRNWFNDFETDPFFRPHRDQFSSFNNFFDQDPFHHALPQPVHNAPSTSSRGQELTVSEREHITPFGRSMFRNMFSGFDHTFQQMQEQMDTLGDSSDAHCYTHSSVSTYSTGQDGQPKYFEATNSERRAPGGVRETRKTVRDSQSDLAKMAVGRHIGDRSHVIEKTRNTRTGHQEEKQNFVGIEQNQVMAFNEEWRGKMGAFQQGAVGASGSQQGALGASGSQQGAFGASEAPRSERAIEDGGQKEKRS